MAVMAVRAGIKHVIYHQKIIIISLEYHPSLSHNKHTQSQDRIQTIYQLGIHQNILTLQQKNIQCILSPCECNSILQPFIV